MRVAEGERRSIVPVQNGHLRLSQIRPYVPDLIRDPATVPKDKTSRMLNRRWIPDQVRDVRPWMHRGLTQQCFRGRRCP